MDHTIIAFHFKTASVDARSVSMHCLRLLKGTVFCEFNKLGFEVVLNQYL